MSSPTNTNNFRTYLLYFLTDESSFAKDEWAISTSEFYEFQANQMRSPAVGDLFLRRVNQFVLFKAKQRKNPHEKGVETALSSLFNTCVFYQKNQASLSDFSDIQTRVISHIIQGAATRLALIDQKELSLDLLQNPSSSNEKERALILLQTATAYLYQTPRDTANAYKLWNQIILLNEKYKTHTRGMLKGAAIDMQSELCLTFKQLFLENPEEDTMS